MHRLEADSYSADDVVVLTLPVTLPYAIHNPGYERAVGEVEHAGEFYHLVKQKIENDTLFIVCLKDEVQKRLQQKMNEYAKFSNNLPVDTQKTIDLLGKLFKDYTATFISQPSKFLVLKYNFLFADASLKIMEQALPIDPPPPRLG
jgi:hypothetical protein